MLQHTSVPAHADSCCHAGTKSEKYLDINLKAATLKLSNEEIQQLEAAASEVGMASHADYPVFAKPVLAMQLHLHCSPACALSMIEVSLDACAWSVAAWTVTLALSDAKPVKVCAACKQAAVHA